MKQFPYIQQLDAMDCGCACLAMVCRYYGKNYPLSQLREDCFATREGVSLLDISHAAENLGFRTRGVRLSCRQLVENFSSPCIIHWKQSHFMVVYRIKARKRHGQYKGFVYVSDPAHGLAKMPLTDFKDGWESTIRDGQGQGIALLLEPTPQFFQLRTHGPQKRNFAYALRYLKPYKKLIFQLVLGILLGAGIQLVFPFLTQGIVDYGIGYRDLHLVTLILVAQLFLFGSQVFSEFIQSWILLHITTRLNISMISDFLLKLVKMPIRFFDSKMIGDLLRRIQDNSRVQDFLTGNSLQSLFSLITLLVFSVVLAIYNLTIFFVFVIASVLYILWIFIFLKKRRELDYKYFAQSATEQSNMYELVTSMQEIKLQNCERQKLWEWENIQAKLFNINIKGLVLNQYQHAGGVFINQLKNILISFLAAKSVISGDMTLGMMMSVQYIIGQLNNPITSFIDFIRSAQDAKISMERLGEIQEQRDEDTFNKDSVRALPSDLSLKVEDLSFRYGGDAAPLVLENVDLEIPHKKTTAVVGMSGSGKTTLVKLLLGFYPATQGKIAVGDFPLEKIDTHFWRSKCGAVMQDGVIFSDTIANNIAVGADVVDIERLKYASEVACLDDLIARLPLGFNTKIGKEGNGLSQGQKQRILIARVVYKNPEYVFFDEATNALDANNERHIMENLNSFFEKKTVLIVAHRLSTVKNADQIVVLKDGGIVERGTHTELVALRGAYYELVKNQLELAE